MEQGVARQSDDRVMLRQVPFNITVGPDAWGRDKSQPVLLSLEIPYDLRVAAKDDDVSQTLDYGKLYKLLTTHLAVPSNSAAEMALRVRSVLQPHEFFRADIVLPKGNLRAQGGLHFTFSFMFEEGEKSKERTILKQSLSVKGIHCACIIGVNSHEREEKQIVVVNLDFDGPYIFSENQESFDKYLSSDRRLNIPGIPHADVIRNVVTHVEGSTYQTVEALATAIAKTVTVKFDIHGVWVEVEKPNAIAAIEAAGVRIYREKSFFTEDNFWQIKRP